MRGLVKRTKRVLVVRFSYCKTFGKGKPKHKKQGSNSCFCLLARNADEEKSGGEDPLGRKDEDRFQGLVDERAGFVDFVPDVPLFVYNGSALSEPRPPRERRENRFNRSARHSKEKSVYKVGGCAVWY